MLAPAIPERRTGTLVTRAAVPADGRRLIELVGSNPILMDAEYVVDRSPDFFRLHRCFPGSGAVVCERPGTRVPSACASLLRYRGRLGADLRPYLYLTDLCRRPGAGPRPAHQVAMAIVGAHLAGDTDALMCLINEGNLPALRMVEGPHAPLRFRRLARLDYVEALPQRRHRIPRRFTLRRAADPAEAARGLAFLDAAHAGHSLWEPLTVAELERRAEHLPGCGPRNVVLAEEQGEIVGALLYCDPSQHVNVRIERYDRWARVAGGALRLVRRWTGLLNAPPPEGGVLRTLQVQAIAGRDAVARHLLGWLGNEALRSGAHTVSYLRDERRPLPRVHRLRFAYKSRLYAAFKRDVPFRSDAVADAPVFFNITHG